MNYKHAGKKGCGEGGSPGAGGCRPRGAGDPGDAGGPNSPLPQTTTPGGGGRLHTNFTRMCVSKSDGNGSFLGSK